MSVKVTKVNLLPVSSEQEIDYLLELVLKRVKPARKLIDDWGENYEHEIPWESAFLGDPKFYLYRVKIGAVGRINKTEDAARLGLIARIPAQVYHFTSTSLYIVYRLARQHRREYLYLKQLNIYMNNWLSDKAGTYNNLRFMTQHEMVIDG